MNESGGMLPRTIFPLLERRHDATITRVSHQIPPAYRIGYEAPVVAPQESGDVCVVCACSPLPC